MFVELPHEPLNAHAEVALDRFFDDFLTKYVIELVRIAEAFPDLKDKAASIEEHLRAPKFKEAALESLRMAYRCGRVHEIHESSNKNLTQLLEDHEHAFRKQWEQFCTELKRVK